MVFGNLIRVSAICIALCLVGCGSTSPRGPGSSVKSPEAAREIRQLLQQAQNSASPAKEQYFLKAATLLNTQGEDDWARNLLASIDTALLNDSAFIRYTLLFSKIAMDDNAYFLAQRILTNQRIEKQWQFLSTEELMTLRQRRADLFALLGESIDSVKERIVLSTLLPNGEPEEQNQDAIWQTLMTLPLTRLQFLSRKENNPLLKGWYTLATLSKNNQTNIERQLAQVDKWIASWPEHPASFRLPSDLQLLQQIVKDRPMRIALLLPSKGKWAKAGKAIRDGFFAAYYQSQQQRNHIPQVIIYDTTKADINAVYDKAVAEGAEMVIGPLDKDKVVELNLREVLSVPTLALNNIETASTFATNLYQFGLSVEDEARQTARRAWLEGHRQAMILTPDNARGNRGAETFIDEWQMLGGLVVGNSRFSSKGNFSQVIKSALHVEQSHRRARQLRQLFGRGLEFEPRRRQDVDFLFLIANPTEARQIKPTLAFHYAGKLPVYATSHIYTGVEDIKNDRDLNNIKFSTLPWVFDKSSAEKQAIARHVKPSAVYHSLYAMGVDTYRLYPRLRQLDQVSQSRFYGATGALRLLANRKIEREQTWAQMRGGRALPLPVVVSESYIQ